MCCWCEKSPIDIWAQPTHSFKGFWDCYSLLQNARVNYLIWATHKHETLNYKNANRLISPDTVSFISPCLILTLDTNKGPITILAVAPGALQLYVSLLMDSWCVIPLISGDATAPPQVSRASPTALLSHVTYLGGFFKKIPKKAFSFLVSSHRSVIE